MSCVNLFKCSTSREQGFTLIEVLIAMFIFSLISVGTMSALSTAISGKAQIETRLDALAELESARALMKSDMANIVLRQTRDEYGGIDLYTLSGGVDSVVEFTRAGRDNPGGLRPRGDLQRVSYIFEDGQLIRRAKGHENPSAITPDFDRVLLDSVANVDIEFITGETSKALIFLTPEESELAPERIMLDVEFQNGDVLTQYFEVGL